MTPMELEAMVKNLDPRVSSIEQILPTLATRQDLKQDIETLRTETRQEFQSVRKEIRELKEVVALKCEMHALFDEAKRYALVLHEDVKSQLGLIAEHLADVMTRLPPRRSQ